VHCRPLQRGHFQQGFYEDAEFAPSFAVLPEPELEGADLGRFRALWVPRESNQALLVRLRDKIEAYLRSGGTLVSSGEVNQAWLSGLSGSSARSTLPICAWRITR
jgi:hypothetical protein